MSQENNFIPELKPYKRISPFRLFVKSNFPFIENTYESLDNYGLYCKVVEYLNTVIANENTVENNVQALYNAFVELNTYVSNYFDNLDVQEEINNKLDDMVEQGTLQEIIADYLNSKAVFGFDTVADMKNATNLISGSYAKTLGYYEKNDLGGSLYKIRELEENEIANELNIITINDNLVAEAIFIDLINVKQFGAKGDGINDDTESIETAWNYIQNKITFEDNSTTGQANLYSPGINKLIFPSGKYIYSGNGLQMKARIDILLEGMGVTEINITSNCYLFNTNNTIKSINIKNITFNGGYGIINLTSNANILDSMKIENCNFINYSKCAIGISSVDSPYWLINKCRFNSEFNSSIGICMPGDCAGSMISNCQFIQNRVHIKLQDGGRGVTLLNNDFIRTGINRNYNMIYLWVLPCYSTGSYHQNDVGLKCNLISNKFGAEGQISGDKIIIFANDSGDYLTSVSPDYENNSNGYVSGFYIDRTNFIYFLDLGNNNDHGSPIYISISDIANCYFGFVTRARYNVPNYLVEFTEKVKNNIYTSELLGRWRYATNIIDVNIRDKYYDNIIPSNIMIFFKDNYLSGNTNDTNLIFYPNNVTVDSSGTAGVSNLPYGRKKEYSCVFTNSSTQYLRFRNSDSSQYSITKNKKLFIEFDLKCDEENPIYKIDLQINEGSNVVVKKEVININKNYNHYRFCLQDLDKFYSFSLRNSINGINYAGKIYIKNLLVYESNGVIDAFNNYVVSDLDFCYGSSLAKLYFDGTNLKCKIGDNIYNVSLTT